MTTSDPANALQSAKRIVTPKKADDYQYETVVGFSAARDVLRRFEAKGSFADAEAKIVEEAQALLKKIEGHAAKHVQVLEADVKDRQALVHGGDWLGHLVAAREDLRGIDALETYAKEIGYDNALADCTKASGAIFKAWYDSKDEKKTFDVVVNSIDDAFLVEGLPSDLVQKMETWKSDAKKIGLDDKQGKKFAAFAAWKNGWKKGLERYEKLWREWKGP
jgi:hypothetical protein